MKEAQDIWIHNEKLAQKFSRIESRLEEAGDLRDLFERLLAGVEEEFAIPFVWINLTDGPQIADLRKTLSESDVLKHRIKTVGREMLKALFDGRNEPVLANRDLTSFYKLMPRRRKYFIRSIAAAPITVKGVTIGALNHADSSPDRYRPDLDTSLLRQMMTKLDGRLTDLLTRAGTELAATEAD
ncbi:MAG TPA: GAF domain-containing protein [Syntrophales bacterium]|nr:GAF domain-containing protein [Syntrophales bacterium]